MKLIFNYKKIYSVLLVSLIISFLQFFIFTTNKIIYDTKVIYLLVLALVNNFALTCIFLWILYINRIVFKVVAYIVLFITVIFSYSVYWYKIGLYPEMVTELCNNARLAGSFINIKQIIIILITTLGVIGIYEFLNIKFISNKKENKSNIWGYFCVLLSCTALFLFTLAFLNLVMKKNKVQGKQLALLM